MKKKSRREFVKSAITASVVTSIGAPMIISHACSPKSDSTSESSDSITDGRLTFKQMPLPYDYAALEPHIDARTMDIHYNKHHAGYVKNITDAIAEEKLTYPDQLSLFSAISKHSSKVRNNAGGAWNHNFFWQIMKPGGAGQPMGKIADAINGAFGSVETFKEQFTNAAMTRFGSGWAWLVDNKGTLAIGSTPNQDNPLMDLAEFKGNPLLALDVWEHAYYLKYQNKRNEYVANWWSLVNWEAVAQQLG